MKKLYFILLFAISFIISDITNSAAQCTQLIHTATDTVGWVRGCSETYGPHFNNDTFVINTAHGDENAFIYNDFPVTLYGGASSFSVSYDFRIDSNFECSDGLTFWFFTSPLTGLGSMYGEGGSLGFPTTVAGFALAFRTISCVDEIYMKKINSTSYSWDGGSGDDTNICPKLTGEMFLTDGQWHHCIVNYDHGYITTSFDGGLVTMSGYSPISGTGHFGFMATNGGGYSRKCLKNIQICAGLGTPTASADSFGNYVNRLCNGPEIATQTHTYLPTYNLITYYGDGTHDSASFLSSAEGGGYNVQSHTYAMAGNYTIKQYLYNSALLIDSLSVDYENIFCATLPIKFYNEENTNCFKDADEPLLSQPIVTEVDSNGIAIDTISATSGLYYTVHGSVGDVYSFKLLSTPDSSMFVSCPATGILYDSLVSGIFIYPIKYIGLSCSTGSMKDLAVTGEIPVTGVHDQWADVYITNAYCAAADAQLTVNFSPKYTFTGDAYPTPTTTSATSLTWSLSDISSLNAMPAHVHYQVDYPDGVALTIGDTVHTEFIVGPTISDVDTTNNVIIIIDTVRAGCDPNEMEVTPNICIPSGDDPTLLQYTINFENTGNDTAHNIYVMDTLSGNLDARSLRLVMASATMNIVPFNDGVHNIIKFDFPSINLLDSSHHAQCNGTVVFKINTKSALPDGTIIDNRAGIYFDVNGVVMTNTVEDTKGCPILGVPLSGKKESVSIYPNPANDILTIKMDQGAYNSFTITNGVGQVMQQKGLTAILTNIDIKSFAPGIYYITLKGDNGTKVQKFVKM